MATALSTLGKNSSGLVGVAISLSLLPPAVNAGICWMFGLLENTRLVDREPDDDTNYWKVGSTSFGLTLLNIVCIWLAGIFTFWLKEVAPVKQKNAFWSRDLKIARQKPKNTGAEKIEDGFRAALDLKQKYNADMGEASKATDSFRNVIPHNRRRMSASKLEDALLLNRGGKGETIPERRIQRSNSDGIMAETEALGGIDKASEVLFNNTLFSIGGQSIFGGTDDDETIFQDGLQLSYHPDTVPPEDVLDEILWSRRHKQLFGNLGSEGM